MNSEKSPEAAQPRALLRPAGLRARAAEPERQRLARRGRRRCARRPHELAEQVDEVKRGQIAGLDMLTGERGVDELLEVLGWCLLAQKRTVHRPSSVSAASATPGHAGAQGTGSTVTATRIPCRARWETLAN